MLRIITAAIWIFNAAWMWKDYNKVENTPEARIFLILGFVTCVSLALHSFRMAIYSGISIIQHYIVEEESLNEENGGSNSDR